MGICMNCGRKIKSSICGNCLKTVDIEDLCKGIVLYTPGEVEASDINTIWEKIASELDKPGDFKNLAYEVAECLATPRKEFWQIMSTVGKYVRVPKAKREWFCTIFDQIIDDEGLSFEEKLLLKGFRLEAYYQDYYYLEADNLATEILENDELPWRTIYLLAEFYSQTRRYDEADDIIFDGEKRFSDKSILAQLKELSVKNDDRRNAADLGKKEYFPNPREGKAKAVAKYAKFMASLGIDVDTSSAFYYHDGKGIKYPKPIPKDEYPEPLEHKQADFDSFVAFDFETTGTSSTADSIIEVGAIKVVNGKIVETKEFTFQEFAKPFKKSLHPAITKLTGITKEDLVDARQMWEVVADFMEFVGDDILVGYNSVAFDSKFLCRAGRYCNKIYDNEHFDVMHYVRDLKNKIQYNEDNVKLVTVGNFLGIENPEAHRALADAITTAKIYLKLKELEAK